MSEPNATSRRGPTSEEDAEDEFDLIKKAWKWLGIALAVLAYGGLGYIQHLLQPYFSVWQILWVTLPLALAVATLVFLAFRDIKVTAAGFFAILVGTLLASALTGLTSGTSVLDYLYHPEYRCDFTSLGYTHELCFQSGYSAPSGNLEWAILSGYVHIYGIVGFIRSILVGGFVGFSVAALTARAERIAKRKQAAAKKARDAKAAGSST